MKRITLLLAAACSLFISSAKADVQYVAIGGHAMVNGVLTPGVTIQTTAVGGTRLPSDWPTPAPSGVSGPTDPFGNNYNVFVVFISGYGDALTPAPAGYFTYFHPVAGVWYTAVDILVTYSYPGMPSVTISADAVRMAYEASRLSPNVDDWGIAVLDVNLSLPKVSVTATDANASETGPDNATFTVSRTGPTTNALTVALSLSGTAGSADYQAIPATVVIPAGASSATVVVKPVDDTLVESSETVVLTLASNAAYTVLGGSATATIADNDASGAPTVTVAASLPLTIELNWIPNGQFTVSRTGSTAAPLTVKVAMSGSAVNGGDYVSIGQNVTIPAGKSSVQVAVDPITDNTIENTETAVMTLTPNAAYTIGTKSTATVYIFDDDAFWAFLQKLAAGWGW